MSLGLETIGGLYDRADEATVAIGPELRLGLLVDTVGLVELGASSMNFVGSAQSATVNALSLEAAGGCEFAVGPVFLGGLVEFFVERWTPYSLVAQEGWRWGLGGTGRVVLPILQFLDLRLDFGFDFFPRAFTFGYEPEDTENIVAELTNWRWRASLGLGIRLPIR